MTVRRVVAGAITAVLLIGVCHSTPQAAADEQQSTIRDFFELIIRTPPTSPQSKFLEGVERRMSGASTEEISEGLPSIMAATRSDNDTTQRAAGVALIAIAIRQDSAALLRPFISDITELFDSEKDYMRRGSMAVLAMMKPSLPPEAVPPLLEYVNQTNREQRSQVGALSMLLGAKPTDEAVVQATEKFMSRSLDTSTRVAALNAIRTSRVKDVRIERIVISELADPSPGVQRAAIGVLDRMGPEALSKAQPVLIMLMKSEDKDVAAAARAALARIAPQSQ